MITCGSIAFRVRFFHGGLASKTWLCLQCGVVINLKRSLNNPGFSNGSRQNNDERVRGLLIARRIGMRLVTLKDFASGTRKISKRALVG